ncbi:hypothetical protein [Ornithinimicrobium kibberense]|uniref:hypothetical protein n=1 Tax=Ornithinimicrobium kibberense TaxID=282060 RepID=UPI003618AD37
MWCTASSSPTPHRSRTQTLGHCGATDVSSAADLPPRIGTSDQPLPGPAHPTLPPPDPRDHPLPGPGSGHTASPRRSRQGAAPHRTNDLDGDQRRRTLESDGTGPLDTQGNQKRALTESFSASVVNPGWRIPRSSRLRRRAAAVRRSRRPSSSTGLRLRVHLPAPPRHGAQLLRCRVRRVKPDGWPDWRRRRLPRPRGLGVECSYGPFPGEPKNAGSQASRGRAAPRHLYRHSRGDVPQPGQESSSRQPRESASP